MCSEGVATVIVASNYSGACEHAPPSNKDLLQITNPERCCLVDGPSLFALRYRMLPCILTRGLHSTLKDDNNVKIRCQDEQESEKYNKPGIYHATTILRFLADEYKLDPNTFLYNRTYDMQYKSYLTETAYIDLGNYLSVLFTDGYRISQMIDNPHNLQPDEKEQIFHCFLTAQIYHVPQTAEHAEKLLQQLFQLQLYRKKVSEAALQMVCHSNRIGFYTSPIDMKKPDIIDLKLHYGDDFPSIHEELVEILQEKNSTGITMLHGPPGTGKTNYLRYLINEIQDKDLIFVPPDLINEITKPSFLPFLMKHPNAILIIEDAENIVHDRKQEILPNQAVSNLLNLSDGLLGDAMHQQIICTFNCDVQTVDPALLREGRLVIEYRFDKLSVEDARRLCVKLGIPGNDEDIQEPMSLAEIYARKNALVENSTNNLEKDQKTTNSKRTLRNKYRKSNSFLGLYS